MIDPFELDDRFSDAQRLQLHAEMSSREWKLTGAMTRLDARGQALELAYKKTRWLMQRAKEMAT